MTFSELLQRDLDDHRVATSLLPYLLTKEVTGPSFFPPLLTVLLPIGEGDDTSASYPQSTQELPAVDERYGAPMSDERFGDAFRLQRILENKSNKPHPIASARLSWNPERIKVVVLDGQHRAMALLAVNRTLNPGLWEETSGRKYRGFYEARVKELIASSGHPLFLDQIMVPVLMCWFPDLTQPGAARVAARKLFVDVNKNARQPSAARLVLLSDSELVNVFTRALLNHIRSSDRILPSIYSIEYDNPSDSPVATEKWSAITNLDLLTTAVRTCVFGPKGYIRDMHATVRRGALPWNSDMNPFMRKQLEVDKVFPENIEDGDRTIKRASLGNLMFPSADIADLDDTKLVQKFVDTWGSAITYSFGELLPYKVQGEALEDMRQAWDKNTTQGSLSHEALYTGTGMFWTLRSAHRHQEKQAKVEEEEGKEGAKAAESIIAAWTILENEKKPTFEKLRADGYLGDASPASIERSNRVFQILGTNACQLGFLITIASVTYALKGQVASQAESLVGAWNSALKSVDSEGQPTALIFGRAKDGLVRDPINRIEQLDTWSCFYFRYLWLELLNVSAAQQALSSSGYTDDDIGIIQDLAARARVHYLNYRIKRRVADLKGLQPDADLGELRDQARETEGDQLRRAIVRWTSLTDEYIEGWMSGQVTELEVADGGTDGGEFQDDTDGEVDNTE